jgi:hypothetical protein
VLAANPPINPPPSRPPATQPQSLISHHLYFPHSRYQQDLDSHSPDLTSLNMSLKRKASFTTITSPCPNSSRHSSVSQSQFLAGHLVTIEETPRHLHSRTRKRFRPDRRDEQTIYGESRAMPYGDDFAFQKPESHETYYPTQTRQSVGFSQRKSS